MQKLSNTTIGALIGLANTILYILLFPLYWPFETFVTFFSFDGSIWWMVMMAFGFGLAILVPNIAVGAVIGMLVSLPRYYWSARILVTLLAFFSSVFIFRVFLYDGNLFQAFLTGDMHYPAAVLITTAFYTYAFNKWVINPNRRTAEPLEE
jgi:hypothetical protein